MFCAWHFSPFWFLLQLNLHQTDLSLTWNCSSIYEHLHRFAQIWSQNCFCYCCAPKIVQKQKQKQFCDHIFANLHKSWINTMSNDGLIIENMDLSHIHLAAKMILSFSKFSKSKWFIHTKTTPLFGIQSWFFNLKMIFLVHVNEVAIIFLHDISAKKNLDWKPKKGGVRDK